MDKKIKLKEVKKFDKWMRKIIKSIHYSNNEKMFNAYLKIK
jgi:hypothetical protein